MCFIDIIEVLFSTLNQLKKINDDATKNVILISTYFKLNIYRIKVQKNKILIP